MERFEDFLQSHNIVARTPVFLRPDGPFGIYVPRTFQPTEVTVPLAATGKKFFYSFIKYRILVDNRNIYIYLF